MDLILYFRNATLHTTRAIASILNLYIEFWRRCQGIVCFVEIDFLFRLILFFYWLFYFGNFYLFFIFFSMFLYRKIRIVFGCVFLSLLKLPGSLVFVSVIDRNRAPLLRPGALPHFAALFARLCSTDRAHIR